MFETVAAGGVDKGRLICFRTKELYLNKNERAKLQTININLTSMNSGLSYAQISYTRYIYI